MPQNAAKSMCILWAGRVVVSGGGKWICIVVYAIENVSVYMSVFVCGADSWTAARSPVTPLPQKSFWWPVRSSCQCFTNTEGASAVQTHAQCHLQIAFTCVHVCSVGWLSECMWIAVPSLFVCALPSEVTLIICVRVCACFVPSRCFFFFFFRECILTESDEHQPVQQVWARWIILGACCGQ